jgi:hypothetical protein
VSPEQVYRRARADAAPYPVTSTDLAFAEARLVADAALPNHRHRRQPDCPCARCPKCVLRRNLLVEAKLAAQARDREPFTPEALWTAF